MPAFTYLRIGRPLEAYNATSPEQFVGLALQHFRDWAVRRPHVRWPEPHPATAPPLAGPQIRQGAWKVPCPCGDFPSYDPDWQLAVCFGCGAVYSDIAPPEGWQTAEQLLMLRPDHRTRNWWHVAGAMETLDALRDENAAHNICEVVS